MTSATVGKRLVTAAVMCGLLVGVSGCESHSVLSGSGQPVDKSSVSASANAGRRDPDRIYANHDKGVPPDQTMGDVKGSEDFNRNLKIYEKWGVKQTSEWLEICNQVNVPVLRKVGVDPQKDLQNRRGGQFKFTCSWFTTHETVQFSSVLKHLYKRQIHGMVLNLAVRLIVMERPMTWGILNL